MRGLIVLMLLAGVFAAACSDDGGVAPDNTPASSPNPVGSPSPDNGYWQSQSTATPTEFRVAMINLMSPVPVDTNNPTAGDTFDARIDILVEELKAFKPDLVGFNEVTWTAAHGAAVDRLAKGLKMEWQYARSNPWFPGQTKETSDQVAKQIGLDEGDCILSRYPILRAERKALNPRTSETEGRAALHVVIKGPGQLGEIDVYITHLTGGGDSVRKAQASDFLGFVKATRGKGPLLAMGDMGEPVGSATYRLYQDTGLEDLAAGPEMTTCCRDSVVGQQPPPATRTDYLLSDNWKPTSTGLLADSPMKREGGGWLYASDHNGLTATFSLPQEGVPPG